VGLKRRATAISGQSGSETIQDGAHDDALENRLMAA
jgi:hypothetical protein